MIRSDHGTAEDAIDFVLDGFPTLPERPGPGEEALFLADWRDGALDEWPEFYPWLDERRIADLVETSGLAEHIVRRSYMESVR